MPSILLCNLQLCLCTCVPRLNRSVVSLLSNWAPASTYRHCLARHSRTHPVQTGSHSASLSAVQGSRVPGRLLYTSLRHSRPTSFTLSCSTPPDRTTLPAQHFRSSSLLCRRFDGLEFATGQSPRPGAQQQQLQTIAEVESISSILLNTHSAVEMLHDSTLYKSVIDSDIDCMVGLPLLQHMQHVCSNSCLLPPTQQ